MQTRFFLAVISIQLLVITTISSPIVGGQANDYQSSGLIKIPLSNDDGLAWIGSLSLGTPLQSHGVCVFDNNNHETFTFDRYCRSCGAYFYWPSKSATFKGSKEIEQTFLENGELVKGYEAVDRLCVGSSDPKADDHTSICLPSARFTMVTSLINWRWSGRASSETKIDSTCGLGKEPASKRS